MSSELFDLPEIKETSVETDLEELNLPEVPPSRLEPIEAPSTTTNEYTGDELFNTYKKFLSENREDSGSLGYASSSYRNSQLKPRVKRRKHRMNDSPRNLEKDVLLWLQVDLIPEEINSFMSWFKQNPDGFIQMESNETLSVVGIPSHIHAFGKIRAGDTILSINGMSVANKTMDMIKASLVSSGNKIVIAFRSPRLLKIAKLSHLKGDLIDPEKLSECVERLGGFDKVNEKKNWQAVRERLNLQFTTSSSHQLKMSYISYFQGVLI